MNKKVHCIINPQAGGGSVGRIWSELKNIIQRKWGDITWDFTDKRGAAIDLTAKAITQNPELILVVGGDGTISEVVNGCFKNQSIKIPPIGIFNHGSGGDFCRCIGIPKNFNLAADRIKNGHKISVDVGHVKCLSLESKNIERYFINILSFGLSGEVVHSISQNNKTIKTHSAVNYFMQSVQSTIRYKKPKVFISLDSANETAHQLVTQAICNGSYFGGGMNIAKNAVLDDGLFHTVLIEDWNILQSFWHAPKLYKGSLHACKGVTVKLAKTIHAKPEKSSPPVRVDCDGESIGHLPLTAKNIPKAIQFII